MGRGMCPAVWPVVEGCWGAAPGDHGGLSKEVQPPWPLTLSRPASLDPRPQGRRACWSAERAPEPRVRPPVWVGTVAVRPPAHLPKASPDSGKSRVAALMPWRARVAISFGLPSVHSPRGTRLADPLIAIVPSPQGLRWDHPATRRQAGSARGWRSRRGHDAGLGGLPRCCLSGLFLLTHIGATFQLGGGGEVDSRAEGAEPAVGASLSPSHLESASASRTPQVAPLTRWPA